MGFNMSKQKLKKVLVRLKDINICESGPHYAEWRVKGVWQKWLSRKELEEIIRRYKTNPVRKKLHRSI
jgi:hypothetical protein